MSDKEEFEGMKFEPADMRCDLNLSMNAQSSNPALFRACLINPGAIFDSARLR